MAHVVTITVDDTDRAVYEAWPVVGLTVDDRLPCTAVCSEGDWDAYGMTSGVRAMAEMHEAGTDRPPTTEAT